MCCDKYISYKNFECLHIAKKKISIIHLAMCKMIADNIFNNYSR